MIIKWEISDCPFCKRIIESYGFSFKVCKLRKLFQNELQQFLIRITTIKNIIFIRKWECFFLQLQYPI